MTGEHKKTGLLGKVREASDDPLSLGRLERLWQADYANAGSDLHPATDESLGGLTTDQRGEAIHEELGRTLERFRHPALIVRADGRIEAMNLRARRSIDADPGETIDGIGYDLVPPESLSRKVGRFLGTARNSPSRVDLWQTVARSDNRIATFAAFRNESQGKTALLFLIDPVWTREAEAMARQSFGLTLAESEILGAFLNGGSLRDIAEERDRSYATVRTQFHSLMDKFGVRSQAELVRSALGISQFVADVAPVAQIASHPHRRRFQILRPGGRSVEVTLAGDRGGDLVIFFPECTLNTFAPEIEARFQAAGLCVASVSRPGYGATSPAPNREDDLDCMAADVEAVIGQLEAGPVVVTGHGSSTAFAFAFAAKRPAMVARLVLFAATVPRPYYDMDLARAPFAASLWRARDASPILFRLIVRASGTAWRRLGTRRFNSLNLAGSEADSAIARSETCVEEFDEALHGEFANGFSRLEEDLLVATSDWSHHARACKAPAVLLHGEQDPVTNIVKLRSFAEAHDHLALIEVPGAGYQLHHTHTDLFVQVLKTGRADVAG